MVWVRGEIKFLVMTGVVITEDQHFGNIYIMISIHQAFNGDLNINKLAKVEDGTVYKINLATDKTFVCPPFVIAYRISSYD